MFVFESIPGMEFEYTAEEMGAIYEAVVASFPTVKGRKYFLDQIFDEPTTNSRIVALPVVNYARYAMPVEGFFDLGFYQEIVSHLRMIINQWQYLGVDARANLELIFRNAFPGLNQKNIDLLVNILRKVECNLEKVSVLADFYDQFSAQLNPLYEISTFFLASLKTNVRSEVQLLYPYIDQSNLFHLIEMNIKVEKSSLIEISVDVVVHNCQAQVFSKEFHTRLSTGLELGFKKFFPNSKLKYNSSMSDIFNAEKVAMIPTDSRTVCFMHYVKYKIENLGNVYSPPVFSLATKGISEREKDLRFLNKQNLTSPDRISLFEKRFYVEYFISVGTGSVFGVLNSLFEMAEFSVKLRSYARAKFIYSRIVSYVLRYSLNVPAKEFLVAEVKNAAEERLLTLERMAFDTNEGDVVLSRRAISTEDSSEVQHNYEKSLNNLNRKIQGCLKGATDELSGMLLQLKNVIASLPDEKLRKCISNVISEIKRPEFFYNMESLLSSQNLTERSMTGSKPSFGILGGGGSNAKKSSEIKTLPDLLKHIASARKSLVEFDEGIQSKEVKFASDVLEKLSIYYIECFHRYETADVSARTAMLNQSTSVVLDGRITDFIEAGDNRLFQVDASGNMVKKGGPGQSAIFYYKGLYSKGISQSAPSGPAFQIAHDNLFRKLFNAETAVTQVMLLSHPSGFNYLLQLSEEIPGMLLQDWLKGGGDLRRLDDESFATCALMCLVSQPGDGKPDNFIVVEKDGKNKIIYFDTDIYGKGSVEEVKGSMHFSMIKSVMYCMPQMLQQVPESLRNHMLALCPEVTILEWLEEIHLQNKKYEEMLAYFPLESIAVLKDKLIVKYDLNFILSLYYSLVHLINELKSNAGITLQQLLQKIDPITYEIYQNANSLFNSAEVGQNVINRMFYIYGNHKDHVKKSIEETISEQHRFLGGMNLAEVLRRELGVVDKVNPRCFLLPGELIEKFLGRVNFSLCDQENLGKIFSKAESFAGLLKKVTLRGTEFACPRQVELFLEKALNLEELAIVGRHPLSLDAIQRILNRFPELDLSFSVAYGEDIGPYRESVISHRGRFSFLTTVGTEVPHPSFYQYKLINYPLQHVLDETAMPSAALYYLQNLQIDLNAYQLQSGQSVAHALISRMNEFSSVSRQTAKPEITKKVPDTSALTESEESFKLYQQYIFAWFYVLKMYNFDPNFPNASGQSSIHLAAEFGLIFLVNFLLDEMGADFSLQTGGLKENIFHIALRKKNIELLRVLFERLDKESLQTLTSRQFNLNGEAPVHLAVRDYVAFTLFLKYTTGGGVNFSAPSVSKFIPLHYVLMEKTNPDGFSESQKSTIVKQLLSLGHDGTGHILPELPADTARRCAPDLLAEINNHYERKQDVTSHGQGNHKNLQTFEINKDDIFKKQYDELFARAEEYRAHGDNMTKEINFRIENAIQSISCLVSAIKIAEQVLTYQNKIPVCEDKMDKLIKKIISTYGEPQPVNSSANFKLFLEARKESLRIWRNSYDTNGANGRIIAEESARKLKQFLAKSIENNMLILGKPPGNYAVYVLGALVTERVDLFSHIPFGFIFSEERANARAMEYFSCLRFLMRVDFLRIAEAGYVFPQVSYPEYLESVFSNQKLGVRVESSEFFANGKSYLSLPIGSPKDVASYMQSPELWRNWSDFATATLLKVDDNSYGNESLVEQLKKKFLESLSCSSVALDYMHGIVEEFRRELFTLIDIKKGALDLNHIFFRFPFLLIEQLCVFFKVSGKGFFENLQLLLSASHLGKDVVSSLTDAIFSWIAFTTRVKNFYQEDKSFVVLTQNDILENNVFSRDQVKTGLYKCGDGDIKDIKLFLSTSYVLYRALITFLANKTKVFYVLNPAAPKLRDPANFFAEIIVADPSKSVDSDEQSEPEIQILQCVRCLWTKNIEGLGFTLNNLLKLSTQDDKFKQSLSKDLKRDFLCLQAIYLVEIKQHISAIKVLDTLINYIKMELANDSLNKLYMEENPEKKVNRKSSSPETPDSSNKVSNVGLAFPLHMLAHSLLHVDLFQPALNAAVDALKIDKKKSLSAVYHIMDALLAIKILMQMGRFSEAQTYLSELLTLISKVERRTFGVFAEVARLNALYTIEHGANDLSRIEIARQLMRRARYDDLGTFGENTQSALSNLVVCYKLAAKNQDVAQQIFARIIYLSGVLNRQDLLIDLLVSAHKQQQGFGTLKIAEGHLQQALSLYINSKDNMTRLAEAEFLMICGFNDYSQSNDVQNLRRAKVLLELLLNTLNSRFSRLECTRNQVQSATLLVDLSRTQIKIEDETILVLKQLIFVKMKLAYDQLLKEQFCQLFDLLKKRAAFEDIMQYLSAYVDIHGHLDSPENYEVILHAAELYFKCVSKLQPDFLTHTYARAINLNIDSGTLAAIPNTMAVSISLSDKGFVDINDGVTYQKIMTSLIKVFSDFVTIAELPGINAGDYQNIFRLAYAYLNTPQTKSLSTILIQRLSENIYKAMHASNIVGIKTFSTFANEACFFQKRAGKRVIQFEVGMDTLFGRAFPELRRLEASNKTVRFLSDKAIDQPLVGRLIEWGEQNIKMSPSHWQIAQGCVVFGFPTSEMEIYFLHNLAYPILYKNNELASFWRATGNMADPTRKVGSLASLSREISSKDLKMLSSLKNSRALPIPPKVTVSNMGDPSTQNTSNQLSQQPNPLSPKNLRNLPIPPKVVVLNLSDPAMQNNFNASMLLSQPVGSLSPRNLRDLPPPPKNGVPNLGPVSPGQNSSNMNIPLSQSSSILPSVKPKNNSNTNIQRAVSPSNLNQSGTNPRFSGVMGKR